MFVFRLGMREVWHRYRPRNSTNYTNIQFYCKQTKPIPSIRNEQHADAATDDTTEKSLTDLADELKRVEAKHKQEKNDKEKKYESIRQTNLMIMGDFEHVASKNRQTFLNMVKIFEGKSVHRRNHVEFIYAALKNMREFGVNTDIEVYRALIDVMPKGKFIPRNMFQQEFMYYPKQQQCMTDLLEQMEENGVIPDYEIGDMLINIFGNRGHPVIRFWRMMYWMPKFRNLSPWLLPKPVPEDALELALLAVNQMCTVDPASKVQVLQTSDVSDAIDDTWIVSGQSIEQQNLLRNHPDGMAVQVEGPFHIWLRTRSISYFVLRGNPMSDDMFRDDQDDDDVSEIPMPNILKRFASSKDATKNKVALKRSVHQQDDGTIYAICATGTSTKDSLLSWIRLLEVNGNPNLARTPVLFRFVSKVEDQLPAVVS